MKNKAVSIPMGMLIKKFYCHKCGERLRRHHKTRIVKRGDPDYNKHNIDGIYTSGDIEVTEYDFQCPSCGNIIEYDEQCVIENIQKRLDKNVLSEEEFANHKASAKKQVDRKSKISNVIFTTSIICVIILALILYFAIK